MNLSRCLHDFLLFEIPEHPLTHYRSSLFVKKYNWHIGYVNIHAFMPFFVKIAVSGSQFSLLLAQLALINLDFCTLTNRQSARAFRYCTHLAIISLSGKKNKLLSAFVINLIHSSSIFIIPSCFISNMLFPKLTLTASCLEHTKAFRALHFLNFFCAL